MFKYRIVVDYSLENKKEYLFDDYNQAKRHYVELMRNPLMKARFTENVNYGTKNTVEKWRKCE